VDHHYRRDWRDWRSGLLVIPSPEANGIGSFIVSSIGPQEIIAVVMVLLAIPAFAFWIWMLVDCATKESEQGSTKIVWIIIIAVTGVVGAGVYWFMRRPQRIEELNR
jgi:hypothetical protein